MRIGIDFDNTIANYDGVFHAVAVERGLIPADFETSKNAVRDHLNGTGRKDDFTELQGYIYGARMDLVPPYPGVAEFIAAAIDSGHKLHVVSHKTRTPILGPAYNMHAAARDFLESNQLLSASMMEPEHIYFELTKEQKVARAAALDLEVFVDDLPEILMMPGLPKTMRRILFDPKNVLADSSAELERHSDWRSIRQALLG